MVVIHPGRHLERGAGRTGMVPWRRSDAPPKLGVGPDCRWSRSSRSGRSYPGTRPPRSRSVSRLSLQVGLCLYLLADTSNLGARSHGIRLPVAPHRRARP